MPEPVPGAVPARSTGRARQKELLRNLLLSLISTSLFLLLIEMTLRLTDLAPSRTLRFPDEEAWAAFPGPFEPEQDFIDRSRPRLVHRIRINSLGFRGRDFPQEKPPGAHRILCLGDSYTFGSYVNEEETFPAVLEAELRERARSKAIEVINGGVSGYTITDEASLAMEKGFTLEPDTILLGFVLNDLTEMTRRRSSRDNQRLEAQSMSRSLLAPVKRILRRTATYNLLFSLKAAAMARFRLDPTVQELPIRHLLHPPYDAVTEDLFGRYRRELILLAESCRRRGIRLVLVIFPFFEQVVGQAPAEAQSRIAAIAQEAGVPVLDLLLAFRDAGPRAGMLFLMPLNHHPSALGYRVAAKEVAGWLPLPR